MGKELQIGEGALGREVGSVCRKISKALQI